MVSSSRTCSAAKSWCWVSSERASEQGPWEETRWADHWHRRRAPSSVGTEGRRAYRSADIPSLRKNLGVYRNWDSAGSCPQRPGYPPDERPRPEDPSPKVYTSTNNRPCLALSARRQSRTTLPAAAEKAESSGRRKDSGQPAAHKRPRTARTRSI